MSILKDNELKIFNDLILHLYDINDMMQFETALLNLIKVLIPYDQGNFLIFSPETKREILDKTVLINVSAPMIRILYDSFDFEDNYLRNLFHSSGSVVYMDVDLLGEHIWEKTKFYRNYLVPEKIPYSCGIVIIEEGKILGIVNLCRGESWGDFTEKELYLLDLLKNHLAKHLIKYYNAGCYNNSKKAISFESLSKYHLTKREFEIVKLILAGYTNTEIAEELIISISTTKKHINSIYVKLDINNRMALIRMFHVQ